MTKFLLIAVGLVFAGLAGCAHDGDMRAAGARAEIRNAAGDRVATATAADEGGLRVRVEAAGMAAGTYGVHVHAVGRCDPPDFASAGSHWNPTTRQHGRLNPMGPHFGDLPNLEVGADGRGIVELSIPGAALRLGGQPVLDADGAAVVIHANPDDYRTDPSGNSGARIACGVLG